MTEQTLTVDRLGHRGDGVSAGPGGEVFVPFSLPGEQVRGAVEGARMAAPRILAAAPERVAPPCPAFGRCGGCALQHGSDAFVAGAPGWGQSSTVRWIRSPRSSASSSMSCRTSRARPMSASGTPASRATWMPYERSVPPSTIWCRKTISSSHSFTATDRLCTPVKVSASSVNWW